MGFNDRRVEHQVKYLGLLENVRVRKAGHSYRTAQEYFTKRFHFCSGIRKKCLFFLFFLFSNLYFSPRYGILCTKTDEEQVPYEINVVIDWIRANVKEINVNDEIHLGKSKVTTKLLILFYFFVASLSVLSIHISHSISRSLFVAPNQSSFWKICVCAEWTP